MHIRIIFFISLNNANLIENLTNTKIRPNSRKDKFYGIITERAMLIAESTIKYIHDNNCLENGIITIKKKLN